MSKSCKALLTLLFFPLLLGAQEKQFLRELRPCYFVSGVPVGSAPDKETADVKFQLSLGFNIASDIAGKGLDLAFGYTQISLWNLFAHSSPFYDNTYVPGLYMFKAYELRSGSGRLTAGIEHRSNGRDDAYSRSINYAFCSFDRKIVLRSAASLTLTAGVRLGTGWYGDDPTFDIMYRYMGLARFKALYSPAGRRWEFSGEVLPLFNSAAPANVMLEGAWCPFRKAGNPYLFIQYHYGYDEAFRDCITAGGPRIDADGNVPYDGLSPARPRGMLRFGLSFTPGF